MSNNDKLNQLREKIDTLDQQIQGLINERGKVAQDVAQVKADMGEDKTAYRPEREAQVLRAIKKRNQGPVSDDEMARLFREIMSACLALEKPMTIAFLGPEGTFTQAAALKHFGHSVKSTPLAAIDEIFREVEAGAADYGVVPVENSTEGVINHTLDTFMNSPLIICGEVDLRVHQNLMGKMSGLAEIKKIYSHQQSFAQCREWLDAHLPNVDRITVSSNAEAARMAGVEKDSAAIAGEVSAELYDLQILRPSIEDVPNNTTRFLIIGHEKTPPSGCDKTTLLVSTMNKPGSLSRLLQPIAQSGISMTRIESRPSRSTMWDYVFFIDIDGHKDDELVATALSQLETETSMLKILGSYPKAVM